MNERQALYGCPYQARGNVWIAPSRDRRSNSSGKWICRKLTDPELLDRANKLERIIFSQDDDLLREANRRNKVGETFSGVIYAHQLNISVGQCISDLALIAHATEPNEWMNTVVYLPLA